MSTEDPRGAILQRDKTTYAIVPRTPAGLLNADILEALARVVRKFEIPIVKITSGQRLALVGLKKEEVEQVWQDLRLDVGRAIELCLHYVQACPGTAVCRFGQQDSLGLGVELEKTYAEREMPAKLKIGVSGCPMCCGESHLRDIGLIGKKNGWTITFGGNSGGRPRVADVLAVDLSREDALQLVDRCVAFYIANGKKKERTARMVERLGSEAVKEGIMGKGE
ncbi:MAG: NAD(P)/FAD-dependent oxidoreductase [Deltaproteobacteria bacterium]